MTWPKSTSNLRHQTDSHLSWDTRIPAEMAMVQIFHQSYKHVLHSRTARQGTREVQTLPWKQPELPLTCRQAEDDILAIEGG